MSADDSGVDAGSNASNESIGMSLASSDSDYDRDDTSDRVLAINLRSVDQNANHNQTINSGNRCTDSSIPNNFEGACSSSSMHNSTFMSAPPLSVLSSIASTSSGSSSSLSMRPIGSQPIGHFQPSTSNNNRMTDFSDHHFDHHFFEDSSEQNSIGVPNDYFYNNEEQHEYCPKIKTSRQKTHEVRRKHIFKDVAGERLLRKAANTNDMETVRKLLHEGIDPQSSDERNRTGLHFAACKGNTQIAQLLLEKGADPNQKDAIGNTALHLAVCTNNIEVITLLLSAGTDINSLDNRGRTPLHLAQSKLKMIQSMQRSDISITSSQLKTEVLQVLQMMSVYWHRSGKSKELELLTAFTNRLHLSQTCEEVGSDVSDLLTSLSHLSL